MTARERVATVRRVLLMGTMLNAALRAILIALLALGAAIVVDQLIGLPLRLRAAAPWLAALVALVPLLLAARRVPRVREPARLALWLEERVPELRYALVTALDPAGQELAPALERAVGPIALEAAAWRAARTAAMRPALAMAAALLLFALLPRGVVARIAAPASGTAQPGDPADPDNALAGLSVQVDPPGYSRLPSRLLDDPIRVQALAGSRVRVEGPAVGSPVRAAVESLSVQLVAAAGRWTASLVLPQAPRVLRLLHGTRERLLLLEPVLDSLPAVTLELPSRDTVLRAPTGLLPLRATFSDDLGLSHGWWELVISSGEGENFRFRTEVLGRSGFQGAREGRRTLTLRLDSLALAPGDLLHLRAVATDGNAVSGPGTAGSETRTIRIARAAEYDSLSIEAMPPADPLKGLLSQRMLILLAEALERRRPQLARTELVVESGRIARDQNALRRQVGEIIFSRLSDSGSAEHSHGDDPARTELTPEQLLAAAEAATQHSAEALDFAGGESPVVAINRPLLEAFNAMWAAGRELASGSPRRALPHMYAALAAIQRARLAERVYLRGRGKAVVVDLAKVRLAGKRDGIEPTTRQPRAAEDAEAARRALRFDAAMERLQSDPDAALDSLLILRAELLGAASAAAAPLAAALDALREGRDATDPLVAARRALAGVASARAGLPRFGTLP